MGRTSGSLSVRPERLVAGFAIVGTLLFQVGCVSERGMYGGLQSRRARAYHQWRRARENEEASKPQLKGTLSLEDALKLAMTSNKSLQAALREKEIARGAVLEAYSNVLPGVSATAGYTRLDEVGGFDVGGRSVSIGDVDNYSVGLEVKQPVFRGGGIPAALRAARWVSLLSDEQVRGAVQAVIYEVARAYYDTLLAQHLYEVNRDAVVSAKAHLRDVGIKRGRGVASNFDVLRAQVDVSLFEAEMIQQRNRVHLAKTRLLRAMGVSQDSEVTLSDELTYRPMKPVLDEAVRLAYQNRPDLYQAELNVQLQQEALRIARSAYWPRVDAWLRQEWARPDPHTSIVEWGDAWSAGVSANWPLFDGFRREGRVRQEEARLRQRGIQLVDAEERVLLEIRQAILSLRDAEEFVQSQRLNLDRAKEALRLAQVEYRQGIADAVTVTEARAALTRAQGLYYEAVYRHTVARLDLQRAMGILGPRAGESGEEKGAPVHPGEIEPFSAPSGSGTAGRSQRSVPVTAESKGKR